MAVVEMTKTKILVQKECFAEAIVTIVRKEKLSGYAYNELMFEWGICFVHHCNAPELKHSTDFWNWWKFKYQLNDFEYINKDALRRGQYDIWKSQMLDNPRLRDEMFTYINQCNESRNK